MLCVLCALCLVAVVCAGQLQPNPPVWPPTVQVFGPGDTNIEAAVMAAYKQNGGQNPPNNGQFSSKRYAFLFKPGTYSVDVPVGFYTHVAGLGAHPDEVVFTGSKGVYCEEGAYQFQTGALDTFWRAAENFQTQASFDWKTAQGMLWAASQAAPLRRVHVIHDLSLFQYQLGNPSAGYASGGYLSNSQVGGKTVSGSQQQYLSRNVEFEGGWQGAAWNMVFVGCTNVPAPHCGNDGGSPFVVERSTPAIAEKPFISTNSSGRFYLNVPPLRVNGTGTNWTEAVTAIDFSKVYVSRGNETAAMINAQLDAGLHVVLSPAIYTLDEPLVISHPRQILMGLGVATLVSGNGNAVIEVKDVDGVRVVGPLLLQAGPHPTPSLLDWGSGYAGHPDRPGFLYDVFARVGGPDTQPVQADNMIRLFNGNVVGDNSWLWRADHTVNGIVKNSSNPVKHALQVFGSNVTYYGLACEHTLEDLTQWYGDNGKVYFYQSEMPYDVSQASWGDEGFVSYRVGANVDSHLAAGVGAYHFFRDYAVTVQTGFVAPSSLEASFTAPFTRYLSGHGVVQHVLNQEGAATSSGSVLSYVCS